MFGLFQKLLKKKKEKSFQVDSKNGWFYLGFGIDLIKGEMGRIYWEKLKNHGIVFGASGSGKSELVARKTYEDILTGFQSFNIDPKGSVSWLEAFLKACYRKGILYDKEKGPIILALPYPEVSFKFNPLQGLTPHQIAYVVASGIPESKEPFWWQISYEITLVVALGLKARGLDQITFSDIYDYISVEKIEELERKVVADTNFDSEYRAEALRTLAKLSTYDPQFFPRVNSSLRTYLTRLITGETGRILNVRVEKNLLEERLEKGELRFFAFLNAEAMKQTAYDVARLLLAWLLTYVGKKSGKLEVIEPQLRVNVDELTEIAFHEINKAVRLVRERNVSMFMLTQSPSGLASSFKERGREIVEDIMNSCDLRVFFRMNSEVDGEYVSRLSPEVDRPRAIIHKNSISITYQKERLVNSFRLQSLKEGYGFAFLDGTVYYFYTPLVKDKLKVKVVWDGLPDADADLVVNMRDLSFNYAQPQTQEVEEDEIVVFIRKLTENWQVGRHYTFSDPEVENFYRETKDFFKIYKEDYLKLLDFVQGLKEVASTVKSDGVFSKISLLDHSIRTALKAYEQVKDRSDLTQEQKEIAILGALSHDFGKAIAVKRNYTKTDHTTATREILTKLGISPEIIEVAIRHHEEPESEEERIVKEADQRAREEERTLVKKEEGVEINANFVLERLKSEANKSLKVVFFDKHLYVEKNFLRDLLLSLGVKEIKDEKIETALGGEFVEARLLNGKKFEGQGVFLRIPLSPEEAQKLGIEKLRSPYAKVRVEIT